MTMVKKGSGMDAFKCTSIIVCLVLVGQGTCERTGEKDTLVITVSVCFFSMSISELGQSVSFYYCFRR